MAFGVPGHDPRDGSTPTPSGRPRPGLRERNKIKTRRAIRTAAYTLIEERGYDATTIEQIADRAEVSPVDGLPVLPHQRGHRCQDDVRDLADRALDVLEHGLPSGKT